MNSILLVLINADSNSLFDSDEKYKEILDKIEEFRIKNNLDMSFLSFYSIDTPNKTEKIISKISDLRDLYPKMVLGKTFTKDNGYFTSRMFLKDDKNKEYIFSYMMKYLTKFIDVGGIMMFDDNMKLVLSDFDKIFGNRPLMLTTKIYTSKKKKYLL